MADKVGGSERRLIIMSLACLVVGREKEIHAKGGIKNKATIIDAGRKHPVAII